MADCYFDEDDLRCGEPLQIRPATSSDLDSIVWIVENGFPDDPGCDYKFPHRDQYPEDFRKWTRQEYKEYLEQPAKFAFLLVTSPVVEDDVIIHKPIALGVWDIAPETKSTGGDRGVMERDDIDLQHLRAYNEAMSQGFEMYFRKYHQRQLHLWMLMTHPQFRRRGAGTMLCNWGLKESAKRGDWPLTLMASPMGKGLYEHLGYKLLGNGVAQISGEEAKVDIYAMEKLIS